MIGVQEVSQFAMLFLCEAASGFDESKGKFSTWVMFHLQTRFIELCRDYKVTSDRMPIDRAYDEDKDGAIEVPNTEDAMDAQSVVNRLIPKLDERTQEIVKLRYGIDAEHGLTLRDTGKRFGLSQERIRQIEAQAFNVMRATA